MIRKWAEVIFRYICTHDILSLRGGRAEPDILVSIHGSAPGSFMHFQNPQFVLNVAYHRVQGSNDSTTPPGMLYSHATG